MKLSFKIKERLTIKEKPGLLRKNFIFRRKRDFDVSPGPRLSDAFLHLLKKVVENPSEYQAGVIFLERFQNEGTNKLACNS